MSHGSQENLTRLRAATTGSHVQSSLDLRNSGSLFPRNHGDTDFYCKGYPVFDPASEPSTVQSEGVAGGMAVSGRSLRSAVCTGDSDVFASEMIKMINDKDFRSAIDLYTYVLDYKKLTCKLCRVPADLFIYSDIRFVVGDERQTLYAHKCLLAARYLDTPTN